MRQKCLIVLLCMLVKTSSFAQFPFFPMGGFSMPDSIPHFPDSIPRFPDGFSFPEGGFPGFPGFPDGFPMMGEFPQGGFPGMGNMKMPASESKTSGAIDAKTLATTLPIVVIDAEEKIVAEERVMAKMRIIDGGKDAVNRLDAKKSDYDGHVRIKLRGNSSLMLNQKKFSFETCDTEGKARNVSLLGLAEENDWVLLAPYNDVSLLRDVFAFTLWREMGHWAPQTRMVEVVLNGEYVGVYVLSEKIKHGKNRVDIASLKRDDTEGRELTGGYILRIDVEDDDHANWQSKVDGVGGFPGAKVVWSCVYPKKKKLQDAQLGYIHGFIDDMERAIASDGFADPKEGYRKYINVRSFIDYFIHTELSLNADAFRRSVYFYKTKQNEDGSGGKLHAGPVWDYNLAYGMGAFNGADNIETMVYRGAESQPSPAFWGRLLDDEEYRKAVKTRYLELRKTVLSETYINQFFDQYAKLLDAAQARHFATYPELIDSSEKDESAEKTARQQSEMENFPMIGGFPQGGFPGAEAFSQGGFPVAEAFPQGGFPMMNMDMGNMMLGMFQAYRVKSYAEEIAHIKQWCADRLAVLDKEFGAY